MTGVIINVFQKLFRGSCTDVLTPFWCCSKFPYSMSHGGAHSDSGFDTHHLASERRAGNTFPARQHTDQYYNSFTNTAELDGMWKRLNLRKSTYYYNNYVRLWKLGASWEVQLSPISHIYYRLILSLHISPFIAKSSPFLFSTLCRFAVPYYSLLRACSWASTDYIVVRDVMD